MTAVRVARKGKGRLRPEAPPRGRRISTCCRSPLIPRRPFSRNVSGLPTPWAAPFLSAPGAMPPGRKPCEGCFSPEALLPNSLRPASRVWSAQHGACAEGRLSEPGTHNGGFPGKPNGMGCDEWTIPSGVAGGGWKGVLRGAAAPSSTRLPLPGGRRSRSKKSASSKHTESLGVPTPPPQGDTFLTLPLKGQFPSIPAPVRGMRPARWQRGELREWHRERRAPTPSPQGVPPPALLPSLFRARRRGRVRARFRAGGGRRLPGRRCAR